MTEVEGGGGVSEGELEDGEVLSSEDDGEGKEEEEGEDKGNNGDSFEKNEKLDDNSQKTGIKRPALDKDGPNPKAIKLQSPLGQTQSLEASNSDAEEGEIFSDDEEAAYFPQRIKSRKTTAPIDHDASGSDGADDKKDNLSRRDRGGSYSPERDSLHSRRQRSKEKERDGEPKSLASLFFEDRDGTPSELSDDGKIDGGYSSKKKGERFSHSNSPARSNRDRERSARDHEKKEKGHYRGKNTYRGRERDWDRDQDSNVDSSEEESSWSQRGPRNKGYTTSYQRGSRRGGGGKYQSKYGQKHDRFGSSTSGDTRGGGGRQGNTSWGHSSGRINTGMTAQEFYAQAENVRKRREKGLSLLTTPNIKPSDNLDQFNYPAPPSWYAEAIEKWDKMKQQKEVDGLGGDGENLAMVQAQSTTNPVPLLQGLSTGMVVPEQPKPQPLFPPSTQFTPPPPTAELNSSILGNPPQPFQPLMPSQVPPPHTQLIPPVTHVQVPSLFPSTSGEMPIAVNPTSLNVAVQPPPITSVGGQPHGGTQLAVVGIGSDDNISGVSTVRVSSLVLDVSSMATKAHGVGSPDEEEEECGMKIALETPTPQPSATGAKSFPLFQTTSTEKLVKDEELTAEDVPDMIKDNDIHMTEEMEPTKMKPEVVCAKEKEETDMEVYPSLNDQITTTQSEPVTSTTTVNQESKPVLETSPPTASETAATNSSSDPTELKTYSPPPMVPPSLPPTIPTPDINTSEVSLKVAEVAVSQEVHMDSDRDSDYDKYLDQLDEEEDGKETSKSSLAGVISANLLQNNPLDEEFPAIDPANKSHQSRGRDVSLKSLLVGEEGIIVERSSSTGSKSRGSKSARRRKKETEWWSRRNNDTTKPRTVSPTIKPLCKYYLNGFCKQGDECQYSHDCSRPKKKERCKFYLQDSCTKGDDCLYIHGDYPCKFFHTNTGCKNGEQCKFSHSPLTEESRELLEQVLEPPRTRGESVAMGTGSETTPTIATSSVVSNHQQQKGIHVVDSQVRVQFFTAGNSLPSKSIQQDTSPLLISIPKQVLDPKSLVVSIPRQKLGPPFGTVPINAPSLAPSNQASIVTPSLSHPPMSVPKTTVLPSTATQSSQAVTFQPSIQPQNVPPPPIQSLPPTNFPPGPPRGFPMPPRPNHPPTNMPPPSTGWQVVTNQPIPLFPSIGSQQPPQLPPGPPQCPPGQPPPQVAPQFHVPPSERKCLLPTPPSHLKLDPKNIQWSEETGKPEYWEAPGAIRQSGPFPMVTSHPLPPAFGNQPSGVPASGPFGTQPPPPHGPPQAAVIDTATQQPAPFNQQQGIQTRMDPRQSRMESRPGGSSNIDPRSVGSGLPNTPIGSNDPRHHGGPPGVVVRPQQLSSFQSPPALQVPMQNFQQGPPTAQWPQIPPPQHLSIPHGPIPMLQTGMGSGIGSGGAPNQLHEFRPPPNFTNHLPPFQQSLQMHSSQPPSTLWGPDPSSTAAVTSIASVNTSIVGQRDGGSVVGGEIHPLSSRIDPRTKYSHFKIKPKGSPSSTGITSSAQSILKGRGTDGMEQGTVTTAGIGERTQMPKLLQEPPSLQRPFDPHELFDTAASKDETSKSQVFGPFGSTFGSFFARSSSSEGGTPSDTLPYGEITMNRDNDTTSSKKIETNSSTTESVDLQENLAEKEELKKAVVPSYLAELGVGENDLTIDSAFSSLDQTGESGRKEEGEQNKAVTAKKLPNIFGLASGPL